MKHIPGFLGLILLGSLIAANAADDFGGVYRAGRAETPCGRSTSFGRNENCPINELGLVKRAEATPETDPGLDFVADGLTRLFTRLPRPAEIIHEDDRIVIHYEYFDVQRVVHLDGAPPPADTPHSLHGYSVGRWENDVLVVETSHLAENAHTVPSSNETTTVERYWWNDDRSRLLLDVEISDPVFYDGVLRLQRAEWEPNPADYIADWVCESQRELFYGNMDAFFGIEE